MDSTAESTRNPDRANAAILRMLHHTAQPLTTIRGILELTLSEAMTAEEKKAWLQKAVEQISQANSSFDQLRKIVEKQTGLYPEVRTFHV
jgi:signal transduction histidine kinase